MTNLTRRTLPGLVAGSGTCDCIANGIDLVAEISHGQPMVPQGAVSDMATVSNLGGDQPGWGLSSSVDAGIDLSVGAAVAFVVSRGLPAEVTGGDGGQRSGHDAF